MSKENLTEPPRRSTSTDVARHANVSRTTVSFVLNGVTNQKISETTREAVLAAARELDYRPNRAARALASGTSTTLLSVIARSQLSQGALMLISALTSELGSRGFSLAVWFESDDRDALGSLVRDLHPAGIFPLFGSLPEWIAEEHVQGSPVIRALDLPPAALDMGAQAQVDYLLAKGHTRIGYAGTGDPVLKVSNDHRRATVAVMCSRAGVPPPVDVLIPVDGANAMSAIETLRSEGVTALCCYNDSLAFIVLHTMHLRGLRCPEDMAVIGYDSMPLSAWSTPSLTTVEWNVAETATSYAEELLGAIGLMPPSLPAERQPPRVKVIARLSA